MKKKTIFSVLAFISMAFTLNAQLATTDPILSGQTQFVIGQNASILAQAVQAFQEEQKIYSQAQTSYGEFLQMRKYLANAEDRLKNIGSIKDLKLNNVNAFLDKVLCVKQGNYFPRAVRFLDIITKMKAAFLNCSNQQLYSLTYSGVMDSYDLRLEAAGNVGTRELNARLNTLNADLFEAEKTKGATNAYNARMKLELGLKYKTISDSLMDLSEELHLAINADNGSSQNITLTSAERMNMMDLSIKYQMQALDYEQKSAQLLKEASEADPEQLRQIQKAKRDIAEKQIINFQL
jgi:hypothetical protein